MDNSLKAAQKNKKILIIGAGPAGLATAFKLSKKQDIEVTIWEKSDRVGGLSKTLEHLGNLFDLGPHRFFTKNKEVNEFWKSILPQPDMLTKNRFTRMFFNNNFFNYPLKLDYQNINKLGFKKGVFIFISYLQAKINPRRPEITLEDFYINRFGKRLYKMFFSGYTEKVWGIPCRNIPKEWGKQRVKDLSLIKMIMDFFAKIAGSKKKEKQASLISQFSYPKYGAGFFYQTLADKLIKNGVKIELNMELKGLNHEHEKNNSASGQNKDNQEIKIDNLDYVVSTMPIDGLIKSLNPAAPNEIRNISDKLPYRSSIIIAILYKELKIKNDTDLITEANIIPDNWIYVQDSSVKLGRISLFNNFSDFMLKDKNLPWMSLEFFCNQGDEFWKKADDELIEIGKNELKKIGLADPENFLTAKVVKVEKSYPAYFGAYAEFPKVKDYLDSFKNLLPCGRNGQHKYNNMDHSIACGFAAADIIINDKKDKTALWSVNTDNEYNE